MPSNEVVKFETLSEPLQLSVGKEITPKQRVSSHIHPKRRTMPIQADDNEVEKRPSIVYGVPQS